MKLTDLISSKQTENERIASYARRIDDTIELANTLRNYQGVEYLVHVFKHFFNAKIYTELDFALMHLMYVKFYKVLDAYKYNIYDIQTAINVISKDKLYDRRQGFVISAMINKYAEEQTNPRNLEVKLKFPKPFDYLFYEFQGTAYINRAGNYLGMRAKNAKIFALKADSYAGYKMKDSQLYVGNTLDGFGYNAERCKLFAESTKDYAVKLIIDSEARIAKTKDHLAFGAYRSKIYVLKAGKEIGSSAVDSELFLGTQNLLNIDRTAAFSNVTLGKDDTLINEISKIREKREILKKKLRDR